MSHLLSPHASHSQSIFSDPAILEAKYSRPLNTPAVSQLQMLLDSCQTVNSVVAGGQPEPAAAVQMVDTSVQTGSAGAKSAKSSPRKKKNRSPRKRSQQQRQRAQQQQQQSAAGQQTAAAIAGESAGEQDSEQENQSPAAKKSSSRRNRSQSSGRRAARGNNNAGKPAASNSAPATPLIPISASLLEQAGNRQSSRPSLLGVMSHHSPHAVHSQFTPPQPATHAGGAGFGGGSFRRPMHSSGTFLGPILRRPWPGPSTLYPQSRYHQLAQHGRGQHHGPPHPGPGLLNPIASISNFGANQMVPPKVGASNEYVSMEIADFYQRNRQTNEQYKAKHTLRNALERTLRQAFPEQALSLYVVGSSTNGIGDNAGAVDLCLIARPPLALPTVAVSSAIEASSDSTKTGADAQTPVVNDTPTQVDAPVTESETAKTETNLPSPKKAPHSCNLANCVLSEPQVEGENFVDDLKAVPKAVDVEVTDGSSAEPTEAQNPEPVIDATKVEAVTKEKMSTPPSILAIDPTPTVVPSATPLSMSMVESVLKSKNFAKGIELIAAKVPLIKFKDDIGKLDVTLTLNQEIPVRNTQLIRDYARMDWRFPHLALVFKTWARENRICALEGTISDYSWTLMVVHYLQVVQPPVLPVLQKLEPKRYDTRCKIDQILRDGSRPPGHWRSGNTNNLRQLLRGLFRYYADFSYESSIISVREGRLLDRPPVVAGEKSHWDSLLSIEEPFSRRNTTRSLQDRAKLERIVELLRMAHNALRGVRISLFDIIADDLQFPITYGK